jgi:hypothetical protein
MIPRVNWMPAWARDDPDEDYWREQARIDEWIAAGEAGDQPSLPISGEWATVREVAARHRKSEKTIRRYIAAGELKAQGDKQHPYRIHRDDELAWINAQRGRTIEAKQRRSVAGKPAATTFRGLVK